MLIIYSCMITNMVSLKKYYPDQPSTIVAQLGIFKNWSSSGTWFRTNVKAVVDGTTYFVSIFVRSMRVYMFARTNLS